MNLKTGLMIAGGVAGALGIGYMLTKGNKPEESAPQDGAPGGSGELTPEQAASQLLAPGAGTTPTAGTDPLATTPAPTLNGTVAPQQQGAAPQGTATQGGAREVGPYTVVPDAQSGMEIVFETATQQPVGVLDEQGNLHELVMDAQGQLTLAPQAAAGSATGMPQASTGGTAPLGQARAGASSYGELATQLFADAGAAVSDPMSGVGALTPQMASSQASAAIGQPQVQGSVQSQALPQTQQPSALSQTAGAQQIDGFTLIPDQAGNQLVIETASQQPVGVLDPQGGFTQVTTDAAGNLVPVANTSGVAAPVG